MHWAIKYVGAPWAKGAQGPDAYDCWGLVRAVYKNDLFNVDLPAIEPDQYDIIKLVRAFDGPEYHDNWTEVETPREGDVVLMARAKQVAHCGVYTEVDGGGVLHCLQPLTATGGGVVFQKVTMLTKDGWGHIKFVRHRSQIDA